MSTMHATTPNNTIVHTGSLLPLAVFVAMCVYASLRSRGGDETLCEEPRPGACTWDSLHVRLLEEKATHKAHIAPLRVAPLRGR
jgi:hypothetical protein